jgi:hypothetical protein
VAAVPERAGGDGCASDLDTFERTLDRLSLAVDDAARGQGDWLSRVRAGLVAFLGFLDDEPGAAQLLLEGPQIADAMGLLRCEQRVLGVLTGLLEGGREPLADAADPELLASWSLIDELVVGGAHAVICTRLREGPGRALVELAPDLLAFITLPYLGQGEVASQFAQALVSSLGPWRARAALPIRVTHRTTLVLRAIAQAPCASNRKIAQAAGPIDEGQLSKLLTRLTERGLVENLSRGVQWGEPNAWRLTGEGERTLRLIDALPTHPPRRSERSA